MLNEIASRPKPGLFTLEQRGLSMWRTLAASRTDTLADVVAHYNRVRNLGFTTEQQRDLVEYLKSL